MSGGGVRFQLEQLPEHLRDQARVKLQDLRPRTVVLCPDDPEPTPPAKRAQIKASKLKATQRTAADPVEPKPRNKYRAQRVEADGHRFDSKHEYMMYVDLKLRVRAGEIEDLRLQVKFSLFDAGGHCRGEHIGTYRADFVYRERGELRVADAKSEKTRRLRDWPRTKALMRACHGIEVIEL